MSLHFLSNHPIDFYKLGGGVNTAPSAPWDTNYVKQTLKCLDSVPQWRQTIPPDVNTDFYWQGRVVLGVTSSNGSGLVSFYSGIGGSLTERFRIQNTNFGAHRLMWNNAGTWTQIGGSLNLGPGAIYALTVRFKFHPVDGEITFEINNALIGTVTGDTITGYNPDGNITFVDLRNPSAGTGAYADINWAEFVITKNENPFLMRVKTHVLQANSAVNTGWTGDYSDVDEADPSSTDILSAATAGLVSTFTIDPLPALGALVVRAVQVTAMARCGNSGPKNLQPTLRASGANQVGPAQALSTGYNPKFQVFETNQVTGVEFTKAEIDASEPGVTSVT